MSVVSGDFLGAFGLLESDAGVLLVGNRRVIGGERRLVWDLPGGRVESGETLEEALRRELREEVGLEVEVGAFLFVAEGERVRDDARIAVWRSFFFAVDGDVSAVNTSGDAEIEGHRFVPPALLPEALAAPYHEGFLAWLASGRDRRHVFDVWAD